VVKGSQNNTGFDLALSISNYNQPVEVAVPENATPLEEIIERVMGQLLKQSTF
jgi:hypothetical protein